MLVTKNRKFKMLGAGWLGLGGFGFAVAVLALFQIGVALFQFTLGNDPSALESEDGFWNGVVFVLVLVALGGIGTVNGLALLRRKRVARPLVAISALVLFIPSAVSLVPMLLVAPSLWLTLSTGGKEAFESYVARANG